MLHNRLNRIAKTKKSVEFTLIPVALRAHKMDYTLHPYTVNVNYETSKENLEKTEWKLCKEIWGRVESVYPCEKK